MTPVTPDPIFQIASSFMAAKHLFVANEVGLFEKLADGPVDLDDLAAHTSIPRRTLRIVTDAMVALGFVERKGNRYQNSQVATTFLSGRNQTDLRPFLRFWNHVSYPRWTRLEEAVRNDDAPFGEISFTDEEQRLFNDGVEAITAGTAEALARAYDFSRHQRVLDVGGGTGSFLMAILREHASAEGTLFELPHVAMVARKRLSATRFERRIRVVEGDCLKDPLPQGHDAILIANVLHLLSPKRSIRLLRRIRENVPERARLLLIDFWTDATHTQPAFAALMAGEFLLVSGEGDVYSDEEVRGWLQKSGWGPVEQVALAGPASLIVAETASS